MKFSIKRSLLLQTIQKVVTIVPSRSAMPLLSNILVNANSNLLTLRSTDLDISASSSAEISSSGGETSFAVNAKKIFDLIKELPECEIFIDNSNVGFIQISADASHFKLPVQSAEEFPEVPDFERHLNFELSKEILGRALTKVRFAVSKDATKTALMGVFAEISNNAITFVATDGHRLGFTSNFKIDAIQTEELKTLIIPVKALDQVIKISNSEYINISIGTGFIEFNSDNSILTSKLIESTYPNYNQVIPKSNEKHAIIRRDELLSSLKRISIMSNSKTRQTKFAFSEDSLDLSTYDMDFKGGADSKINVSYKDEALELGFNADYCIEILRLIESEEVKMSLNSSLSATIIESINQNENEHSLFIIMPLRLLDDQE